MVLKGLMIKTSGYFTYLSKKIVLLGSLVCHHITFLQHSKIVIAT